MIVVVVVEVHDESFEAGGPVKHVTQQKEGHHQYSGKRSSS